jgi:TPR repeat protein
MKIIYMLLLILLAANAKNISCGTENLKRCYTLGLKSYKAGKYQDTLQYLKVVCNKKQGPSCGLIGAVYRDGKGDVKKNTAKALAYFKKGCEGNYPKICTDMGILYQQLGKTKEAIRSYQKGCKRNIVGSCYNIATMYYFADGVKKDLNQAGKYYKKACLLGDQKNACQRAGIAKEKAPSQKEIFQKQCRENNALGCHNLSALYYTGKEVRQDFQKSLEFEKKACMLKYAMGCRNVGLIYFKGEHIPKNGKEALSYFKAGGSIGDGGSFFNAGYMYEHGALVQKDLKKAYDMYVRGCLKRDQKSCLCLGRFYEKGIVVKQRYDRAIGIYKEMCKNKYAKGCRQLAYMYLDGKGVKADLFEAKMYFRSACDFGDEISCKNDKLIQVEKIK